MNALEILELEVFQAHFEINTNAEANRKVLKVNLFQ